MTEIILGSVIMGLLLERYFYSRSMNQQVNDCMKALMSRNVHEYIEVKEVETKKETKSVDPDLIPLEQADDETFLNAIKGKVNNG